MCRPNKTRSLKLDSQNQSKPRTGKLRDLKLFVGSSLVVRLKDRDFVRKPIDFAGLSNGMVLQPGSGEILDFLNPENFFFLKTRILTAYERLSRLSP